jgi:hypothetical protein
MTDCLLFLLCNSLLTRTIRQFRKLSYFYNFQVAYLKKIPSKRMRQLHIRLLGMENEGQKNSGAGQAGYAFWATGFTTAPERMQRVQTRICFDPPPAEVATRTFCRFGSQRRLVLL